MRRWLFGCFASSLCFVFASFAQEWQGDKAIRIFPIGVFELNTDRTGLGLGVDVDAFYGEHLGLHSSLGYFQLEGNPDLDAAFVSMGPVLKTGKRVVPSVSTGAGLFLTDYSAWFSVVVGRKLQGSDIDVHALYGRLSLSLHASLGLDIHFSERAGLGIEARATDVLLQGSNLQLLQLHAGMKLILD